MASFERLIRFVAEDGKIRYGNLTKATPTLEIEGSEVEVLQGDVQSGFSKTGEAATVKKVCFFSMPECKEMSQLRVLVALSSGTDQHRHVRGTQLQATR